MRQKLLSATSLATTLLFLVPGAVLAQGPVHDWSGPYIGGSFGVVEGSDFVDFDYASGSGSPSSVRVPVLGPSLTVTGGYNFQNGPFVYGIEADGTLMSVSGESKSAPLSAVYDVSSRLDSLLTLRGRLGVTSGPLLFYATAGVGAGEASFDALLPDNTNHTGFAATTSGIVVGPVIGAGAEYALNDHVGLKVEGLVADLGTLTATGDNGKSNGAFTATSHTTAMSLRTGVNVHF
jgi:outer membrane immunogenic protein